MDKIEIRSNCFTLIRYIMALTVIVWHSHRDIGISDFVVFRYFACVPVFFFISGFLTSASLDKNRYSIKDYLYKRFLRIYPELWISVFLCATVIIIQFPYLLMKFQYYLWLFGQSTIFQFWTPDLLRFYGNGTPNGSLWTIPVNIQFYVLIYYLYPRIKKLNLQQDLTMLALGVLLNGVLSLCEVYLPEIVYKLVWETILPYAYMFYLGIIFYKYFDQIVSFLTKHFYVVAAIFVLECFNGSFFNFIPHTSNTAAPIHVLVNCVFWFSFAYKFRQLNIKKDYSYGIYVLNMIFLNLFVHNGILINHYATFVLILIMTVLAAVLSDRIARKLFHY
ncbi:MAG: acyltransferase [Erysipelotrichaceae bacterium]|nr:acyltransferase [Erysipelotrichaceae bacterium]